MTHLQKLRTRHFLKWGSFNFTQNHLHSLKFPNLYIGACRLLQNPRFYGTRRKVETQICENVDENLNDGKGNEAKISRATWVQAQTAVLEYLHSTRSLQFVDAENMSKNAPRFLDKLLKRVETNDVNTDIKHSITRFLRYHPINEFEPFFESLGLHPLEYAPLLPRDLMFLNDDKMLLENYHVLCNYGIARSSIGKMYKAATEIFHYDYDVLMSKIQVYEKLGLSHSLLMKVFVSSPSVLIGDIDRSFMEALDKLKSLGFDHSWIESRLSEYDLYNWRQILEVLRFFKRIGFTEEQLVKLITENPRLLFEGSGKLFFSLIVLLLKFGSTNNELSSMFLRFPQYEIMQFVNNLRHAILFFTEIEMEPENCVKIVCSYPILLGTSSLKKSNSLLANLNIGKKRLRKIIIENPEELKNWVLGSKIEPVPSSGEVMLSQQQKIKFLLDLGFVEDSKEMKRALKVFRGKGGELQERFNCFVKAGLDRNDVCRIVKTAPQALNQTKEVIERKIDFLLNSLNYPISTLTKFPGYISYTIPRVKLRYTMYTWLRDKGKLQGLSLSTLIASSDKLFERSYVELHPNGPQVWQKLRKEILSE